MAERNRNGLSQHNQGDNSSKLKQKENKIEQLTDDQLLQELKDKGLPVFGTKQQKQQRLKQSYGIYEILSQNDKQKPKTKVLDEIQKLQQKREERRAKQDEYKLEKLEKEAENQKLGKLVDIDFQVMIEKQRIKQQILKPHGQYQDDKLQVIIRKRPIFQSEEINGEIDCLSSANPQIVVHEPKHRVDRTKVVQDHVFTFDNTYNENESTQDIYKTAIQHLIPEIFQNGVLTCFAYGQTGSGKTYTMNGIQEQIINNLYELEQDMVLMLSFYEIYGGQCYDLLTNRTKLDVLEDKNNNIQIQGLFKQQVDDKQNMLQLIKKANQARTTHSTVSNEVSSRSHAICQILITKNNREIGKLMLVDLAGSERAQDTQSNDKNRRQEGADINKSLLALKECIRAISNNQNRVPFRGSKLTLVLQNSFIQKNSKMIMIGCVSPNSSSSDHTLNTLRYADRLKTNRQEEIYDDLEQIDEQDQNIINRIKQKKDIKENNYDYKQEDLTLNYHMELKKKQTKCTSEKNLCNLSEDTSQKQKKIQFPPISKKLNINNDLQNIQDQMQIDSYRQDIFSSHISAIKEDASILKNESDLIANIKKQGNEFNYNYIQQLEIMIHSKLKIYQDLANKINKFKNSYVEEKLI